MSGLTARAMKAREGKMTGSRIATLVTGSPEDQYNLWLELTGDPSWKPKDYSKNWAVQLGKATEKFHLDWIQQTTGDITKRGSTARHKDKGFHWATCTLDGWAADHRKAVEAKHVGGFEAPGVILERYTPQMQWTMFVTDTPEIIFSVIHGTREPKPVFIGRNQAYIENLAMVAERFMQCVYDLREPVPNPFEKPPLPVFTRILDMTSNNHWASAAADWIERRPYHIGFESAAKRIKETVPADAKECFGHGIRVTRNKAGALTIKLEETENAETQAD